VRTVVEAKFADTLHRYAEHLRKLDAKLEAQREVGAKTQQRYQGVQGMLQVRGCDCGHVLCDDARCCVCLSSM
jgi:hypothetical protein